jgi:hypothetical protein
VLMNAPHYCMQILPWTRSLTNYLNDDWLCITNVIPRLDWPIMFTHPFRGGRMMIISPSHLIVLVNTESILYFDINLD